LSTAAPTASGHLLEQFVALLRGQIALNDHVIQQDLDVDLVVRAVDAGRVVDRVVVQTTTGERVLDAAALRHAEVAALADDLGAELSGVHAQGVVGLVAGLAVRLSARLHVGPDPAVPQQVDGRSQDRADQVVGGQGVVRYIERGASLWRDHDRLRRAGPDTAALGNLLGVVVRPR
jgi:hypothetical protein